MPDSYGGPPPALDTTTKAPRRTKQTPLSEDQLVAMLRREETDASSFYTSELAMAQTDAMDAYNGKLKNDEVLPNRSQVVTQDVRDAINWAMPALMRTFAPGDDFVTVDDNELDDNDPTLTDAAEYLKHVYFRDNKGEIITHDFAFDGLLQKSGVARAYWEPPQPKPPYIIENCTADQIAKYLSDDCYQILEATQDGQEPEDEGEESEAEEDNGEVDQAQEAGSEAGEPGEGQPQAGGQDGQAQGGLVPFQHPEPEPTWTIKVQHRPKHGKLRVECIPPEQFRISRRARSIEQADYHCWQFDAYLADLVREHPDKAADIDPEGQFQSKVGDMTDTDADLRVYARFPDEPSSGQRATYNEDNRHKVQVNVEYLKVDYDGDGIVELRRCKRVGNTLIENDIVEESEFVIWSPNRVAHRAIGQSVAETIMDIQRIRTELMRRGLDSLAHSTMPRTVVNKRAVQHDPTLLDRFLDHGLGDVLDVDGDPNQAFAVMALPDVSDTCFTAIEYMDRRSEEASGINRHAMGIQPQAITDTAKGIEALQSAANARIEQIARWLGLGLEDLFGKMLRCLTRNQDHERLVKIQGRKIKVDPRRWNDEMTVSVHVGMAGEGRERRLMMLNDIKTDQAMALKELGVDNPLVKMHHLRNTLARKAQAMGFKNAGEFWGEVDPNWQPPQADPAQDPKLLEVQGKQQLAQTEMQSRLQLQQAELQQKDRAAAAEVQHKMAALQQEGQIRIAVEGKKAESEHEIAKLKLGSESELVRLKMAQELQLAREKMAQEAQLARETAAFRMAQPDTHISGFRPGGDLDA